MLESLMLVSKIRSLFVVLTCGIDISVVRGRLVLLLINILGRIAYA